MARATVAEIDEHNILQASLLAMHRAVLALAPQPAYVLVDGNRLPRWEYAAEAVVKGDDRVPAIAAASILAKVQRDRELVALEHLYPGYGFAAHKGYPTAGILRLCGGLGLRRCIVVRLGRFGPYWNLSSSLVSIITPGKPTARRQPPYSLSGLAVNTSM